MTSTIDLVLATTYVHKDRDKPYVRRTRRRRQCLKPNGVSLKQYVRTFSCPAPEPSPATPDPGRSPCRMYPLRMRRVPTAAPRQEPPRSLSPALFPPRPHAAVAPGWWCFLPGPTTTRLRPSAAGATTSRLTPSSVHATAAARLMWSHDARTMLYAKITQICIIRDDSYLIHIHANHEGCMVR